MWAEDQRQPVLRLIGAGVSDYEIARRTGVPRSTVGHWRRNPHRHRRFRSGDPGWRPLDPATYCYVLGFYLGDGHIVTRGASARLCLTLDRLYEGIADEAEEALVATFPDSRVARYDRPAHGKIDLQLSTPSLPFAFPQCGPGPKHERAIELSGWQRELTRAHPERLLRGLIHSDGCRTLNRFATTLPSGRVARYEYPRYFFSNLSADIRSIFCEHCELLGIRWTLSNPRNVSVSHRDSVALLDEFVGPKA